MMESSGEDTDWEHIQHSFDHHPSSLPPQGASPEYKLVIRDNFFDDNSSVFPPREHEDLPLLEREDCRSSSCTMSPPQSPLSSTSSDVSTSKGQQIKKASNSRLSTMMNEIRITMYTIGRKVFKVIPYGCNRCTVIPASAVAVVALFAFVKILQWRNRLLLLLREKDQRISQLMHQIAHMNEILSARRKVPVLRI